MLPSLAAVERAGPSSRRAQGEMRVWAEVTVEVG